MATLILHLHADFFQLLLGPSHNLVGCSSLPSTENKWSYKNKTKWNSWKLNFELIFYCSLQILNCLIQIMFIRESKENSHLASCSSCSSSCAILASRAVMEALNLLFTEPSSSPSLARSSLFWRSNCWRAFSLFCAVLRSALNSVVRVSTWGTERGGGNREKNGARWSEELHR